MSFLTRCNRLENRHVFIHAFVYDMHAGYLCVRVWYLFWALGLLYQLLLIEHSQLPDASGGFIHLCIISLLYPNYYYY